jgi:hypothetical protein
MNERLMSEAKMEVQPPTKQLWLVLQPNDSVTIPRSDANRNTIHKYRK